MQIHKLCSVAFLLVLLPVTAGPVAAAAEGPSHEASQELSQAVEQWILGQTTDGEGDGRARRGYFSRDFRPIEGDRYLATVHIETAGVETKTTRRHLLTLQPTSGGFEVVETEVQDTYAGLHRETASRCIPFDELTFDREGMQLSGGAGTLCALYYRGRVSSFAVHAADMKYRYEPPSHATALHLIPDVHSVFDVVRKDHSSEFEFAPAALLFGCDPDTCDELLATHFSGLRDVGVPARGGGIAIELNEETSWARPLADLWAAELRANPFAYFREPYRPGERTYYVFVARQLKPFRYPGADQPSFDISSGRLPGSGVALVYDAWGGFEVEFQVLPRRLDIPGQLFGTIYGYYTKETLADSSPYELETRDDRQARWYELHSVSGTVELGLSDPEMLSADLRFGIVLKREVRELPFVIASMSRQLGLGLGRKRKLSVNSIQLDGKELTWTKTGDIGGLALLPEAMPAGTKLDLRMNFETRALIKYTHSFIEVDRLGWMPFWRGGDFIEDFDLTLKAPAGYKTLGVGRKVSETREGDVLVTHWVADSPVNYPVITFGRYREDTAGDDFQATKSDGTPIPVIVHVDEASLSDREIRPDALRPLAQQAVNSINLYRDISGVDYPYGELNIVADREGMLGPLYGMAPGSLIFLGYGVFQTEGQLAPHFTNATRIAKFLRGTTAHEVGHQWWANRIGGANPRNVWFQESLAEYFSALFLEAVHGKKEYDEKVEEWRQSVIETRLMASVQNATAVWSGDQGRAYTAAVYNKGPYAFHMLREIFGDEKFFPFLKQFSQGLAQKREIVTLDIQHAAEKALGGVDPDGQPYNVDLGWFFDQWIRGIGLPQYRIVYDMRQAEDRSWLIEGDVQQRVVVGSNRRHEVLEDRFYRGVVDITVKTKRDRYARRLIIDSAVTPFRFKVPDKPLDVALNEHGEMLSIDVLVNRRWD